MRRGALRSALSERLREGNLLIIDEFGFKTAKTKDFLGAIGGLGLQETKKAVKTLIVDSLDNENLILSSRNVEKTKVTNSFGLNIYDIIYHEKLLISKAALEELTSLLDPKREGKSDGAAETATEAKPKAKKKEAAATEEKPKAKKEAAPKAPKTEKAEKPAKKAKAEDVEIAPLDTENPPELPAAEESTNE